MSHYTEVPCTGSHDWYRRIDRLTGEQAKAVLGEVFRGLLAREALELSPGSIEDDLRAEGVTTLATAFLDGREAAFTEIAIVIGEALLANPLHPKDC